ncbi:carboxylate-amine ligase [Iamia sp.]|uniref:carboxylate-amine ligase n=1 Tax=Iamia sp. TaxID=2722710 RepID=UPI002B5F22C4|nr:YbdK family carboxylate-amine ligase [Iamia sp.]HXH57307.1 YbdK family carboxylate-amine ligase [Iamia sp.]
MALPSFDQACPSPPPAVVNRGAARACPRARLDVDEVRGVFDATDPFTIGLEEEVLLVDPATHAPAPVAAEVVRAAGGDARIKQELPACQVELLTRPHRSVEGARDELAAARAALIRACDGVVAPAAAAVHPWAPATTAVGPSERHRAIEDDFGEVARRQLIGALQVHVALGTADCTLAVYNALRGYLPEIAALAAAAPFYEGRDTGLASVRPVIAGQLPRQGVPPVLESWDAFVDHLEWGTASGTVPEPRRWWWELRPHVIHGTLEVRVPDVQPTVAASAAVAETVYALIRHLAQRHHDGEALDAHPTWRIAENRWCALRDGIHGRLADLESGEAIPTRRRLRDIFDQIEPHSEAGLDAARAVTEHTAADQLRQAGLRGATGWLIEAFHH